jgi:isoleucyl-tRNA synthetase
VPSSPSATGSAQRNDPLRYLIFVALLAPLHPACADEVYKSVDAQGHVVYSDRAATPTAQKSVVHVIPGNPAEAARAARETNLLKAEENQRKREQDIESRTKAQQDHDKQVACERVRNRYNSLKDANLLYRLDAQGNRVFYTDAEGDAHKEQARQAMVAACRK